MPISVKISLILRIAEAIRKWRGIRGYFLIRQTPNRGQPRRAWDERREKRFFRNLFGWQRKPRVWPGQAAPKRSIYATYCTLGAKRSAQSEFNLFVP